MTGVGLMKTSGKRRVRIGILGGAFNPIHNGHLLAADIFARRLELDRILLLPSAAPFYKPTVLTSYEHRLAMCVLASAHRHNMAVSNLEQASPEGMYTCDVVDALRQMCHDAELFLLVGGDVASRMSQWKNISDIVKKVHVGVLPRIQKAFAPPASVPCERNAITLLTDHTLPLSSTMVREAAQRGQSLDGMVPQSLARYIFDHHLYPPTRAPMRNP